MKALLTIALLALAACVSNDPIPNTPHPGYPCGYVEHSCGNGACCPNDSDCGGAPSCGEGLCCYSGSDKFGAKKPTKQRVLPNGGAQ